MVWLWLQSLVLLALTFGAGLWLGRAVSQATTGALRDHGAQRTNPSFVHLASDDSPDVETPAPVYHGAVFEPEPEPDLVPEPEPLPVVAAARPEPAPAMRVATYLLFPVNQFGVITVTQAPAWL